MCAAIAAGGCLFAAVGCCALLYIYAFSAMISPRIIGWDRWMLILQKMLLTPSVVVVFFGVLAVCIGIAIVTVSVEMAFGISVRNTHKITSIAVLSVVILVLAVLVAIST